MGVIGQGYVGLPLSLLFSEAGFPVVAFDLDPAKTMVINRMQIERNGDVAAGPLRLNGEDITLTRCLANGSEPEDPRPVGDVT